MTSPRPASRFAALALALALGACDARPIALDFDRAAIDRADHVFPTDQYRGEALLDAFSEAQLATLPFLRQLRLAGRAGYSAATALQLPFTPSPDDPGGWIDPDRLLAGVRVYRLKPSGPPESIPLARARVAPRTNTATLFPNAPWAPGPYAVAVLAGRVRTRDGAAVIPSRDYGRVIASGDPRTDEAFAAVAAADPDVSSRAATIAFFTFTVADDGADLAHLRDSVLGVAPVSRAGVAEHLALTPLAPAETRAIAVGAARTLAATPDEVAAFYAAAGAAGAPTAAIGRVVTGDLATPNFLSDPVGDVAALFTNATFRGANPARPPGLDNPLALSASAPSRVIPYLALYPVASPSPPPVVVALHGISRQKEDWLAAANTLCAAGHVVVAIDLYQHGARQRDIAVPEGGFAERTDPVLAAAGVAFPDPFLSPTFLARTRDKLRQSLVDALALVRVLAAADGTEPLVDLDGDALPDHFGPVRLVGQSLGAILGAQLAALSPDLDRALLSVPGGSLLQILEESPALRPDIDLLLYATANAPGFGLLAGQTRGLLPDDRARELFDRVAETLLGGADPLSTARAILSGALDNGRPRVLVQLALGDLVVPNATNLRFVQALAAGADDASDLPQIAPVLVDAGLPTWDSPGLPRDGVATFAAPHTHLLDGVVPAATAAAQAQMAAFLTAP